MSIRHVFHELAHAVQFGPDNFARRASPYGYQFKLRKVTIRGEQYEEPTTPQATLREAETVAIARHLMESAGYRIQGNEYNAYYAHVLRLLPDWYAVPGEDDDERKAWRVERIAEQYDRWSAKEAIERLDAWLELTGRRLKRFKPDPHLMDNRWRRVWHADGTLLSC